NAAQSAAVPSIAPSSASNQRTPTDSAQSRLVTYFFTRSPWVLTFPSFHTVAAIVYAWAVWPIRSLRSVGALWNGAMIVSTPVNGGHYFADILAGALVAVLSIRLVGRLGRALHAKENCLKTPPGWRRHCGVPRIRRRLIVRGRAPLPE
ncbi:phosphatase PAP2 family protein, partial [Bradyrhizobium sp.]|uniref:phosphatase PAP2 family protein n=1 Tax=Bradyrhizobium sp. TaxID=376 RepID=UPI00239A3107